MRVFFDPKTNGFYDDEIHGPIMISGEDGKAYRNPNCLIPINAIEISEAVRDQVLRDVALGKSIASDGDGMPIAVGPMSASRDDASQARKVAYADPINGSDRLYIEWQRQLTIGEPAQECEKTRLAWIERADQIAIENPFPEE